MSSRFEVLDAQITPLGLVSLRRRYDPALETDVFEVKLGDEFLMSSYFTTAERELARLGLGAARGEHLDVLVGGLGLGYTAITALADERVASLTVVDALPAVIDWHQRGLLPDAAGLGSDPRVTLVEADFFALVRGDIELPGTIGAYEAVLLDVDHSPRHVLHPSHAPFYTSAGVGRMRDLLRSDGVFALWSDDPPDNEFLDLLGEVFSAARAEVVTFPNPITRGESRATVYLAQR